MKTLKFSQELVELVKTGKKTTTWRLFDDKDLKTGDLVIFLRRPELTPFAEARITHVSVKSMAELTDEDRIGHEDVGTGEEIYKIYSGYYNKEVTHETEVKVIKFEVLKSL
jgi:hypothetical protein